MTGEPAAQRKTRLFGILEIAFIVAFACVPLFSSFPYRVNIFLSWEGAYRLSEGQIPYRDFGMPMGYMYWVIPALFFKIFGAQMITLVKAQVFINIISGLAFRSILKSIGVQEGIRLISVMLYVLSYSFFNFWPWYNHTVIVYEMVGLAFLMKYMFIRNHWLYLSLSALAVFCSFFTKQDGGGLAFILCFVLLLYYGWHHRQWRPLLLFTGSFILVALAFMLPVSRYNFGYWFNHGQPPHTARISLFEILDEFFISSQWIKFYLFLVLLLAVAKLKSWKQFRNDKKEGIFLLLTLGILAEAAVLQVTSYTPPDNNIFFHSFAFVYILSALAPFLRLDFLKWQVVTLAFAGMFLWWSSTYWKYFQRVFEKVLPASANSVASGENVVNRKTYMIFKDTAEIPMSQWTYAGLPSFHKIYMPKPTVDGIHRLLRMPGIRNNPDLKFLNMTELTPLAREIPYRPEQGPGIPLWYHLGVSMFNKEAKMYEERIRGHYYDYVLFEYVPTLNNFYPFRVRDSLQLHYHKIDSFFAPRRGDTKGVIELYSK